MEAEKKAAEPQPQVQVQQAAPQPVTQPVQQAAAPQPVKQEPHPRVGGFTDTDVSIEKFFYYGN